MMAASERVVDLAGSPYEVGFRHGRVLQASIRAFADDRLARVNVLRRTPLTGKRLTGRLAAFSAVIERELPLLHEEIHGIGDGAEIGFERALVLQCRRELIGYSPFTRGECTTLAYRDVQRGGLLLQTVDLNGRVADLGCVLRIEPGAGRRYGSAVYSLAGLAGFAGVNTAGLAIGINLVLSGRWRVGIPPYLLVRHLLDRCGDIDECLTELERLPRASSRALTLVDANRRVTAEMTVDRLTVIEAEALAHANHYLHPDLRRLDRINPFAWRSSCDRLELMQRLVDVTLTHGNEDLLRVLGDHSLYPIGLCAHGDGDPRRDETVAALILAPEEGRLYATLGAPCRTPLLSIDVPGLPARAAATAVRPTGATAHV